MTSSFDNDSFTQISQFRSATSQLVHTTVTTDYQAYQDPNLAPSSLAQAAPPSQPQSSSRPHTIIELAEHAEQSLGDTTRPFEAWLRIAENAYRDAKSFYELGVLQSAFVEYAKAATIVLEKIPAQPEYRGFLSTAQRHNMGLVSHFYLLVSS